MTFPTPGTLFVGRYEVADVLGKGGFATVFRAYDRNSQRDVALKIIDPGDGMQATDLTQRFEREVRIIANLRDPHTVTMFDSGRTDDGLLFFAFEFIAGHDLEDALEAAGRLSEEVTRHIIAQVLSSLREAHSLGLLHRDIKPANIRLFEYLGDPYYTKVLDFGIAREVEPGHDKITSDGAIIGTPRFMAPEQMRDGALTPATDIYAVGLVAYRMLTGQSAAGGRTLPEIALSHLSPQPFAFPEGCGVSLPMQAVIARMIAKDPSARFQSAEGVLRALEGIAQGATAPLATPSVEAARPQTRPPAAPAQAPRASAASSIAMTAAALVVSGLVAFGLISILAGDDDENISDSHDRVVVEQPDQRVDTTEEAPDPPIPNGPLPREVGTAVSVASVAVDDALHGSGCGRDRPGENVHQSKSGQYSWETRLPENYQPGRPYPLLVLVPDTNQGLAGTFPSTSGFDALARERGLILVSASLTVPAFEREWGSLGGAVSFLDDAVQQTVRNHCVDVDRVYLVGHGRGAQLVEQARCKLPLAAIATTSWRLTAEDVANCGVDPIPFIHFVGEKDFYNPIAGGKSCLNVWRPPLTEKESTWRKTNACGEDESTYATGKTFRCKTWDCEAPFVSCTHTGGYSWPHETGKDGARALLAFAPRCKFQPAQFDLAAEILKFLLAQKRPSTSPD